MRSYPAQGHGTRPGTELGLSDSKSRLLTTALGCFRDSYPNLGARGLPSRLDLSLTLCGSKQCSLQRMIGDRGLT